MRTQWCVRCDAPTDGGDLCERCNPDQARTHWGFWLVMGLAMAVILYLLVA